MFSVAFGRIEEGQYGRQAEALLSSMTGPSQQLDQIAGNKQVILFSSGFHEEVSLTDPASGETRRSSWPVEVG